MKKMKKNKQKQASSKGFDIESLRHEYESSTEWNIRRKFLLSNADSLTLDRLVCLSQCFINMAMYGCKYPNAVMTEVHERSGGILEEINTEKRSLAKQKYAMSFVKASDSAEGDLTDTCTKSGTNQKTSEVPSCTKTQDTVKKSQNLSQKKMANKDNTTTLKEANFESQASLSILSQKKNTGKGKTKMTKAPNSESQPSCSMEALCSDGYWSPIRDAEKAPATSFGTSSSQGEPKTTSNSEKTDSTLQKIYRLAHEIRTLKVPCQNAKEKIHSAGNKVPVHLDFTIEAGPKGKSNYFVCHVTVEGVAVATGQAPNIKNAKTNACEVAMQKIMSPSLQIVQMGQNKQELQVLDKTPQNNSLVPKYNVTPQDSSSAAEKFQSHKESNIKGANLKRKSSEFKNLNEFIIVEPLDPLQSSSASQILRQSADFSCMLLEYEYTPHGDSLRCIVRIENQVVADSIDISRPVVKNTASAQCLKTLKKSCWVLKTKKAVDAVSSISKEEILNEINVKSNEIGLDNVGSKLLRKMGWSGGGVGKDGSGIAEPVSMTSVINREGLGLSSALGITKDFRLRVRELIENYAASGNQDDLVFSCELDIEERKLIHEECRKLNLRSVSRGKGEERYLCVSRKRSANQLFDHVLSSGGETAKYKLLPPGSVDDS